MKNPFKKLIAKFVVLILLALGFRFFVEPYQVSTSEMAPTLLKGDYVWVFKQIYGLNVLGRYLQVGRTPKRGEVVLLKEPHPPHHLMFKRIIALPGDRLFYSKGVLFINEIMYKPQPPSSVKQEWDFLRPFDFPGGGHLNHYVHWQEELSYGPYSILKKEGDDLSFGPYKIPKGHYFVMGDHRSQSRDSRSWPLQARKTQGVVVFHKKSKEPLKIPKNTILYANEDPYLPVRFMTLKSVFLKDSPLRVKVQALDPGLSSNVKKDTRWEMKDFLKTQVSVRNDKAFSGGQDKSLVPFHSIKGRPLAIFWSCEKTLPLLNFLCQFDSFRKERWFWPVHKKTKGKLNDSK